MNNKEIILIDVLSSQIFEKYNMVELDEDEFFNLNLKDLVLNLFEEKYLDNVVVDLVSMKF